MTGGTVVVLGAVGGNFAAGMTGGHAWVYDADGSFCRDGRYHPDFVTPQSFSENGADAQTKLREMLALHVQESGSSLGQSMLADWPARAAGFVHLTPKPQA